jgi:histidinol-phosphate aminotransferase
MSRSVVAAMTAYTLELREAEVKLNQNESPFDFPRALKERVLAAAIERPWNIYPDFENATLRSAIARFLDLTSDNILVGNGSNELLAATIATFVGPGTPVIFPRPTFALYEKLVSIAGGLPVPIEFDPDSGFLPLDEILEAVRLHENAVVVVCSPNNPTGSVLPERGLEALLESGAMVLFDQAYADFDVERVVLNERLVTFRTFSKAFGLAALRVGWLISTASNCREIRKVKLPYSLNAVSEMIATTALDNRAVRDANVAAIVAERERVVREMSKLRGVRVFPTQANFVTSRVGAGNSPSPRLRGEGVLFDDLLARGILVRDVSSYPRLKNCLRVSIGSREQNDAFLAAIKEVL